ncbi:MAG TPA: ATP-binding cassette domain-containing protein [Anaerolineales bacterium]|nr:ATP-binding cassette domain-containing protein [Anaerolineales bacterium]
MKPLLRIRNVSKSFGSLPIIEHLSFDVQPGEVVGLTGSIGSGKSVLVMMLAGMYEPNEGEIFFAGKRLVWPFSGQALGIGVIHQRPTLAGHLDVVSNIFLGNELGRFKPLGPFKVLDPIRMHQEAFRLLNQLGVQLESLHEKASNLSIEQRQMIAIARVLTFPAKLVIIDEPTVLLSYPNQQRLLSLIQSWREQGVAVLFSSNNLEHLFAVTDRIVVLNHRRKIANLRTDETSREEVVGLLLDTTDLQRVVPAVWDFDSYDRFRETAEKLRFHQMLLEKDLAGEDSLNRQLTKQLAEQVQALDQANLALIEAQRRILSEREFERKYLAREIHDQVIQDLLSVNYDLESIEAEQNISTDIAQEISDARQEIRALIDGLRRICSDLRPPTIDSLGLGAAIQSYVNDWSARAGIAAHMDLDENLGRLPESTELSIFRIVQEGLNNVRRHAQASAVEISLQHTSPRTLMIAISDNGRGIPEEFDLARIAADGHYGLVGVSERVALLGGRFRLQRLPEGGAQLLVEIPHPRVDVAGPVHPLSSFSISE